MPCGQAHHFLSTFPPCRFLSLHRALVSTSKFRQWVEPVAFAHVSFPFPATLRMTSARCLYGYGVGVGGGGRGELGLLSGVEVGKWGGDLS